MAVRSTNTMAETMQKFLADLSQAKLAMDADLPFILQLETQIVDYLRQPVKQMEQQGMLPPGATDQGAPMGAPSQAAPQGPMVGGLMPSAAMPNGDELRRYLGNAQGA